MKSVKTNKIMEILTIIFIVIFLLFTVSNISLAAGSGQIPTNATIGPGEDLTPIGNPIIGFIQYVGSAVAVIMVAVVGVKYMTSSVEEKAEYKQTFIYYVIGAILVFGAVNILSWIYKSIG